MFNYKKLLFLFFFIYIIFIINFVIIKYNGNFNLVLDRINDIKYNRKYGILNANFIPFRIIKLYINNYSINQITVNLLGNICIFIPLGILLPSLFKSYRKFFKLSILCIFIITIIEILQFTLMIGYFDIDDIILNFTGCIIGYLIFKLISLKLKKTTK